METEQEIVRVVGADPDYFMAEAGVGSMSSTHLSR